MRALLFADAGLLRVQLGEAVAGGDLQPHALLGNDQQCAALFAGFAQQTIGRHGPVVASALTPGPARLMANCLLAFGLAREVQRDHTARIGLDSVQWLRAEPLMDSTSKPAGRQSSVGKCRRG